MKLWVRVLIALVVLAAASIAAICFIGCATISTTDPPNLYCVDTNLNIWRCGQPGAMGFVKLVGLGITKVLKLNFEDEPTNSLPTLYCPISAAEQMDKFNPPTRKLLLAANSITPNTAVHCEHGQDRTGIVIAMWRVLHCGWSKADAEKEMMARGFHPALLGLAQAWKDFQPPAKLPPLPKAAMKAIVPSAYKTNWYGWDYSSDPTVIGYRIYYGYASGKETVLAAEVGTTNAARVLLPKGVPVFITCRAFNAIKEADNSNECHWPQWQYLTVIGTNLKSAPSVAGPWRSTNSPLSFTNPTGAQLFRASGPVTLQRSVM